MDPQKHPFIFQPGNWTGEGSVAFESMESRMLFATSWQVEADKKGEIKCIQKVKLQQAQTALDNHYVFHITGKESFDVELKNETLGTVNGSGMIKDKTITWDIFAPNSVQGFEVFELQDDGSYSFHAEYASPDQFRTIINGKMRRDKGTAVGTKGP